ncbi:MAG: SWIM zinc finger family protein [Candidatus Jordarchaeaceae archaeon]
MQEIKNITPKQLAMITQNIEAPIVQDFLHGRNPETLTRKQASYLVWLIIKNCKKSPEELRRERSKDIVITEGNRCLIAVNLRNAHQHYITSRNGQLVCDCEDYRKGNVCKHIIAAKEYIHSN